VADDAANEEGQKVVEQRAHQVAGEGKLDDDIRVGTLQVGRITQFHTIHHKFVDGGGPTVRYIPQH
jgi:hypothetical protein